ncbi:MAG: hypothetical protein JJ896_07365 [Rhodothermales bacterium]|nr:hypothetical protein [Rhodothermales bacterium]MBO6779457.1 hypothetical protein [Rhodothermales bacterium]
MSQDLKRLADPFDLHDLRWKPIGMSEDRKKARVAPFISNRAIMDRLDAACGPENWRNEYREGPAGGVLCGIGIRVARDGAPAEWVTKWDGAENTEIQPVKGGLSASMRRCAVQWGIGRYLYRMPVIWAPVDEKGRMTARPEVPKEFHPVTVRPIETGKEAA